MTKAQLKKLLTKLNKTQKIEGFNASTSTAAHGRPRGKHPMIHNQTKVVNSSKPTTTSTIRLRKTKKTNIGKLLKNAEMKKTNQ